MVEGWSARPRGRRGRRRGGRRGRSRRGRGRGAAGSAVVSGRGRGRVGAAGQPPAPRSTGRRDHLPRGRDGLDRLDRQAARHRALRQAHVDVGGTGGVRVRQDARGCGPLLDREVRVAEDDLRARRSSSTTMPCSGPSLTRSIRCAMPPGAAPATSSARSVRGSVTRPSATGFSIRSSGEALGRPEAREHRPVARDGQRARRPTETSAAGRRSTTSIRRPCGKSRSTWIEPMIGNSRTASSSSSTRTWSVVMSSAAALERRLDPRRRPSSSSPVTSTSLTATSAESRSQNW